MYKIASDPATGEIVAVGGQDNADAVGMTNTILPRAECGEVLAFSNYYKIVDGSCVRKSVQEIQDIITTIDQNEAEQDAAIASIKAAYDGSPLKGVTIPVAETWIDNRLNLASLMAQFEDLDALLPAFDNAALSELKAPIRAILVELRGIAYQLGVRIDTLGDVDKKQLPGVLMNPFDS